jgi:hypothetical protein
VSRVADRLLLDVANRRKLGVNITSAVVGVERSGSMESRPSVLVQVSDPRGELANSRELTIPAIRHLGTPESRKLRPIDLRLDGTTYRLAGMRPSGGVTELDFQHRGAVLMEEIDEPLSASRGGTTRAQFIRRQVEEVGAKKGAQFRLAFWAWEVDRKMPTQAPDVDSSSKKAADRVVDDLVVNAKTFKGITSLAGHPVDFSQRLNMAIVMSVAHELNAGPKATLALVMACIVEAPAFNNPLGGHDSSVGILQLLSGHLGGSTSTDGGRRDVALVARMFLTEGFTGKGGAMKIAAANPTMTAGIVAAEVQGPREDLRGRYDAVSADAQKVIAAAGGNFKGGPDGATGTSYVKPYRFKRPRGENAWENTGNLAEEVGRRRFITMPKRGLDLFVYAGDEDLLRLDPQARINLDASYVISAPDYEILAGDHVQSMRLTVRADEFDQDFAWGIPVEVVGGGAAGRWLVWDVRETDGSPDVELDLRQPEPTKKEPVSEVVARNAASPAPRRVDGNLTPGAKVTPEMLSGRTPKHIIDNFVIPVAQRLGFSHTAESVAAANAVHGPTSSGGRSDHQGPPSVAWAADLSAGGDMDRLAAELASMFGFPNGGEGSFSRVVIGGYSFQLLWQVEDHYDHVHIGVQAP